MARSSELAAATAVLIGLLLLGGLMDNASRDFVIRICIYGLFALSLNLLIGYAGLISFGHALFFAGGAYVFVFLMQSGQISIPVAFLVTLAANAVLAAAVGAICVRSSEIYFVFLTLAFQMMFYSFLYAAKDLTGGDEGLIGGIPRPPFLGINLADPFHFYSFVCTITVIGTYILRLIVTSPFGYVLRMVRDNADRAAFIGVNVTMTRFVAFVVAGTVASAAGALLSLFVSGAYPNFAFWTQSGNAIFMVVLGGMSWFLGPFAGAFFLLLMNDLITAYTEHYGLFLGVVILLVALGLRRGILEVIGERLVRKRWPHHVGQRRIRDA